MLLNVYLIILKLTQDEIFNQFQFILPLVLQHSLEVFLPAGNVDGVNGLLHHLPRRRLTLGLTRWDTHTHTHTSITVQSLKTHSSRHLFEL